MIVNDKRPICDVCRAINDKQERMDWLLTIQPVISQSGGDNATEIYLCNKHHRLLMKTFDSIIEEKKGNKKKEEIETETTLRRDDIIEMYYKLPPYPPINNIKT